MALYLAGAAQLDNLKIIGPGGNMPAPTVSNVQGVIPNIGARQVFQLVTATIVDDFLCKQKSITNDRLAFVVAGKARQNFEQSTYSQHSIKLPTMGRPWDAIESVNNPPGLPGVWAAPLKSTVTVHVDGLQAGDRIDIARPSISSSSDLSWEQADQLSVLASWTNTGAEQRAQEFIFIWGLLGGIGITFLSTALLRIIERALPEGRSKNKHAAR